MGLIRNITLILSFSILLFGCDMRDYHQLKVDENSALAEETATDTIQPTRSLSIDKKNNPLDTSVITHHAVIKTSSGLITIGLYGEDAPETVANFIGLVKLNYYNGVLFHRVAKNFLIQTGDRNTLYHTKKSEWGFGGESFYGGDIEDELDPNTPSYRTGYVKGVVAMANKGQNTNTSQFFICLDEAEKLKHKWSIFGKVIEGMYVVEKISNLEVEPSEQGKNDGIPIKPVRIYSVNVKLIKAPEL